MRGPGATDEVPQVAPGRGPPMAPHWGPGKGMRGHWWDGELKGGREKVSENKIQFHYINQI